MIIIRKATLDDAEHIAQYLFLAMEEIVYKFIGFENAEAGINFILNFVQKESNQYSYHNCWVLVDDMQIVAAINVYNGAALIQLRQPIIEYVRSINSNDFEFEDETEAGEHYIDCLGVEPSKQRKGLGTMLLQFVIDEYVHHRNQTLGLLVDEDNPKAKKLYLKLGFKSVGKKILFGKRVEHLQIKGEGFLE